MYGALIRFQLHALENKTKPVRTVHDSLMDFFFAAPMQSARPFACHRRPSVGRNHVSIGQDMEAKVIGGA